MQKHKHISRIDQESKKTHGWYVRVRHLGKPHCKFFSDSRYGGKTHALLEAIIHRNNLEKQLGRVRTDKNIRMVSNTDTGVVGVTLDEKRNRYTVSWVTPQGKPGKTSVSTLKYGQKKAFKRACAIRKKKEQERVAENMP